MMSINLHAQYSPQTMRRVAVMMYAFASIVFAVVTPPFQKPDEAHHFYRCWQILQGQIAAEQRGNESGGVLPASLPLTAATLHADSIAFHPERKQPREDFGAAFALRLRPHDTVFVNFSNTAVYSPLPYMP
jgi:Predicted membrane protein (DUF2142)